MKRVIAIYIFLGGFLWGHAQNSPYQLELIPIHIEELGGLQSFAFATYEGEWLIVGGRLDGLHQRQPFASFDVAGHNQDILVVNPETKMVWKKSIATLPSNIKEQLSSTNMQFYHVDDHLVLTGGYGYSPSHDDHVTFPFLTVMNVASIIEEVKLGSVSPEHFKQISDPAFRVAGGRLAMIDDVFYLVGGHKFMGRYNPMGPDHGPGFEQEYTNEIRKFKLSLEGEISVDFLPFVHDAMHLRKRDYNLTPFIHNDAYGLMAYSGVFQNGIDLPWLYPVKIGKDDYNALEEFNQYFNHYHCATLPIYHDDKKEMNTLFFGGIAQFYLENGVLVQDNDVPFVNTISNINMGEDGQLIETVANTKMPGYLGAGSEFIFADEALIHSPGILDGANIGNEFYKVGYIFGGIRSSMPNIFWINTGTESEASNTIYEVRIKKNKTTASELMEVNDHELFFYPNPTQHFVKMGFKMDVLSDVDIEIFTSAGNRVHQQSFSKAELKSGFNLLILDEVNIGYGAYIYKVSVGGKTISRKVVWSE